MKNFFRRIPVVPVMFFLTVLASSCSPGGDSGARISGNEKDSLAMLWLDRGIYYGYRDADSALYCSRQGLKYAGPENPELYVALLTNAAEASFAMGDMDESIRAHLHAYDEATRLGSSAGIRSSLLASAGLSWKRKSEFDSALFYYNKAVSLLEGQEGVSSEMSHVLVNIAALYVSFSRLDEAEVYARKAVEATSEDTDIDDIIYAYSTVGAILAKTGRYDESMRFLREALGIARKLGEPKFELKVLNYILAMFNYTGERDSVEFYDMQAVRLMDDLAENLPEVLGYKETAAKVFSSVGKYRESNMILSELLADAGKNEQSAPDILYQCMARNYMAMHMYREASECYEKAYAASDSIHSADVQNQLSEWSVKYDTREKELEISRLEAERIKERSARLQWLMTAVILMLAFLSATISYVFRSRSRRRTAELDYARKYIEGLEKERRRIAEDLHDGVCNDLLGIGMLLKSVCGGRKDMSGKSGALAGAADIVDMIEKLRKDVRYISHELMPPEFRYSTLDEIMAAHMEKFSMQTDISLEFVKSAEGNEWKNIPENISYEVYRIFQELLSNILRHSEARDIEVCLRLGKNMLQLDFDTDAKVEFPADGRLRQESKGIGLSVIRERVKTIGACLGMKGRHFSLTVPLDNRRRRTK